jgi:hypothetical protein
MCPICRTTNDLHFTVRTDDGRYIPCPNTAKGLTGMRNHRTRDNSFRALALSEDTRPQRRPRLNTRRTNTRQAAIAAALREV